MTGLRAFRAVCLVPRDAVRGLLPGGLELDDQSLTPSGTHPMAFHFSDVVDAHLTVPNVLPSLTYCELIVSIVSARFRQSLVDPEQLAP